MKTDKYQEAVEYLTANPSEIQDMWMSAHSHVYGCLFNFVMPNKEDFSNIAECGCLTHIRQGNVLFAIGKNNKRDIKLTNAIRSDNRLPNLSGKISSDHLPIFAEWQRRIDYYYSTGILDMERDFTIPNSQFPDTPAKEIYIYQYPKRTESSERLLGKKEFYPSNN